MSSLSFVPHSLKKRPKAAPSTATVSVPGPSTFTPTITPERNAEVSTPVDDELAVLLSLALSDFALAADPALRDPNHDGCWFLNMLFCFFLRINLLGRRHRAEQSFKRSVGFCQRRPSTHGSCHYQVPPNAC